MTDLDLELPFFKPWKEKRQVILDHFKTNEKLSLSTSFLLNGMENDFQGPMKNKTTQRRDPLNDSGGPRKVPDLTMDDYIRRLNDLKKLLLYAWANDCRVEALKIVIELTKILSTTLTPHFYPSQFVLVTDIVDLFGSLVYERLHRKATEERMNAGLGPLPKYFTLADVPDLTRQTASNWFYKISEILELIPRLYVEAGLLCCMKFMDNASISTNVMRLCVMARSISHPLVSSYARAYICRISMRLNPADRAPHWKCLNDWMQTYNQQPTALLWPAMEWVIQCVSYNAVTYEDLCPLWEYCRIPTKRAMILEPILNGVSPVYLATHALEACKIVTGCDEVSASELCAFGRSILQAEVSTESKRPILRSVWRRMSKLSSLRSYVLCCDVWIEFAARFFSLHELSVILDNLIKKIVPDKKYENFYENLLSILYKLVQYVIDIDELLLLDHFATLLELFREDELKSKSATLVLNSIVNKHKTRSITDFALANQVVWIAKRLHDAMDLNSAISQDGPAPEAILIEAAFDRFDLSADPERGLSVLVDARGALYNLNTIIRYLVVRVNDLALPSRNSSRLSARGRASFTRACLAYGFITIASLSDSSDKVRLYIQSIQVALSANALSQTDAIVRECIELLAVLNKPPVIYLNLCSSLLGVLLAVPDSPSKPPLYLFKAFLNAIQRYPWPTLCNEKGRLLIRCLCWLSASRQPDYPVRIGHVQSNDQVYVLGLLIQMMDDEEARPRRPTVVCMELLEAIVAVGDVNDDDMAQLALNLYTICSNFSEFSRRTFTVITALKETGHPLFAGFPSRN
ncbi:hypothetical protein QR680_000127 [Steinernema hermaphroditum]|uniref:Uncharacterized protein n=1 Tax=Steinernema hermaphroditum TaxID=289476 RepID=A0AA39GTG9_9BILA|nr:hypothetical protein QR680_000127 [Steinernema hermaphroditum]